MVAAVHAVSVPGLASFGMFAIRAFGDVNVPIHEFSAIWAIAHRGIGAAVIEVGEIAGLVPALQTVKEAVLAGELDPQLLASKPVRKRGKV